MRKIESRPYVHYLGYVAGRTKDALYKKSQGLLWPSFYEGYGFPPIEASFHGRPVITSYKTSLPEIMRARAIYVDPYNVSDLYQALVNLKEGHVIKNDKEMKLPSWREHAEAVLDIFKTFDK